MRDKERIALEHAAANKVARAERARLDAEQKLLREAKKKENADAKAARVSSLATVTPGIAIQLETLVPGEQAAASPVVPGDVVPTPSAADPIVKADDVASSKPAVVMNTVAGDGAVPEAVVGPKAE